MARRLGSVYLWVALLLAVPIGRSRDLLGKEALIFGYAAFVALTAIVIWKIGVASAKTGRRVREGPKYLPAVLLLSGPLVLLLGASVTGEPTAARPGDYLLNTTAILLGSLILVSGFVALSVRLWAAGQRTLPALGLAALLVGAAIWLANLVFRYAVVASGAARLQAAVEDRAWVANEYLRGLDGTPSWLELVLVWTDMLQLAFVLLAYLSASAFGAALVSVGWLGRVGGGAFVGLNLSLACAVVAGMILAGYGSAAGAWTTYVLTIPFMVFVLPYFLGVTLIQNGEAKRVQYKGSVTAPTPVT